MESRRKLTAAISARIRVVFMAVLAAGAIKLMALPAGMELYAENAETGGARVVLGSGLPD